jgi:hypothetical protein
METQDNTKRLRDLHLTKEREQKNEKKQTRLLQQHTERWSGRTKTND